GQRSARGTSARRTALGSVRLPSCRRIRDPRAPRRGDRDRYADLRPARTARVVAADPAVAGERRTGPLHRVPALSRPGRAHLRRELGPGTRVLLARMKKMVPRTGIEPVTPAFSVLCSTN